MEDQWAAIQTVTVHMLSVSSYIVYQLLLPGSGKRAPALQIHLEARLYVMGACVRTLAACHPVPASFLMLRRQNDGAVGF